jgi:hypothetical protein
MAKFNVYFGCGDFKKDGIKNKARRGETKLSKKISPRQEARGI